MTDSQRERCRLGRRLRVLPAVLVAVSMAGAGPLRAQSPADGVIAAVEADCDALARRATGVADGAVLGALGLGMRDRCVERSTAALSVPASDPVVDRLLSMQCRAVQAVLDPLPPRSWDGSDCLRAAARARLKALDLAWVREVQSKVRAVLCRDALGASAPRDAVLGCVMALGGSAQ